MKHNQYISLVGVYLTEEHLLESQYQQKKNGKDMLKIVDRAQMRIHTKSFVRLLIHYMLLNFFMIQKL